MSLHEVDDGDIYYDGTNNKDIHSIALHQLFNINSDKKTNLPVIFLSFIKIFSFVNKYFFCNLKYNPEKLCVRL